MPFDLASKYMILALERVREGLNRSKATGVVPELQSGELLNQIRTDVLRMVPRSEQGTIEKLLRKVRFLPGARAVRPPYDVDEALRLCHDLLELLPRFRSSSGEQVVAAGAKIFIGHGRSNVWKDLKDFLENRLGLSCVEFNSEPQAGKTTVERLREMAEEVRFAFLVMTAEEQHADKSMHARDNVIHEIGFFQAQLGPSKTVILFEERCSEPSNIRGLTQIRFPKNKIDAVSEEIRRVLEREGMLGPR